ncbi:Glu/Leu/Phe/Val family dehydrogenase [Bradyrhizobium sp. B120]|uniref:Glu/Leu/Phe/Val family dehydrogenase n=1 Tax=Bradyrhizobium sp. B120 TaxID=3410088 RepID=UPI003B983105
MSAITRPHTTIPSGLDIAELKGHILRCGQLGGFLTQSLIEPSELLVKKCDVFVPAAIERVITSENASELKCRILAEGADGPTTPEADAILHRRGDDIFVLPDILCNAGGVIVSYFEWVQDLQRLFWGEAEVFDRLCRILERSFQQTRARARRDRISHRMAAMAIGVSAVQSAKRTSGLFP